MKQFKKIIKIFPTQQFNELRFNVLTYKTVMFKWGQQHVHKVKNSSFLKKVTRLLCKNLGYVKDELVISELEYSGLRARNQSKKDLWLSTSWDMNTWSSTRIEVGHSSSKEYNVRNDILISYKTNIKPVKPQAWTTWGGRGCIVLRLGGRHLNTYLRTIQSQSRSHRLFSKDTRQVPNGLNINGLEEIEKLIKRNTEKGLTYINKDLFRILRHEDIWISVYQKLAVSPGSMTTGQDGKTIDGTNLNIIRGIKNKVMRGDYCWNNIRRVEIPKSNGKKRSLGILTFSDKMVQGAIKMIVEAIYEPKFSDNSHGFRPNRSQHSALRNVRKNFGGVIWYIEGDIEGYFDTIDHNILIKILEEKINDRKLLKQIYNGLKARVVLQTGITRINTGVPQGGVLSPLLSNIYLDKLDLHINKLKSEFDRGEKRKNSLEYNRITKTQSAHVAHKLGLRSTDPMDKSWKRLHYVRYADDFIVGIIGSKEEAQGIKQKISKFLTDSLKLTLNEKKTLITHNSSYVLFLGYSIGYKEVTYKFKIKGTYRSARRRILTLMVDMNKVIKKLAEAKFCRKDGDPLPCFQYMHQTQSLTNARINSLLEGLVNYYHLANNKRRSMNRVRYILQHSAAKMYAAKFKLKTRAAVFKLATGNLGRRLAPCKGKNVIGATDEKLERDNESKGGTGKIKLRGIKYNRLIDFSKPDLATISKKKTIHMVDPTKKALAFYIRGTRALGLPCLICGTYNRVEMHHIRGIADIKEKNALDKALMAAARKQIPLCREHHLEVHGKRYHKL